ncbi:hypothetical protein DFJ58DRAFT_631103, partial [Suillus subalutaceus]|uniref:uncharacterized protein n=1 Tax=Suillus subalutaceus TaxID=48586 RepID=UPI001B85F475
MIGYMHGQKAYKLMDLAQRTVFSSRHVTFNETDQVPDADLTPWNVHPTGQQWEGLFPLQHHHPDASVSDEEEDTDLSDSTETPLDPDALPTLPNAHPDKLEELTEQLENLSI